MHPDPQGFASLHVIHEIIACFGTFGGVCVSEIHEITSVRDHFVHVQPEVRHVFAEEGD